MEPFHLSADLTVDEVLGRWPETIPVFLEYKMTCVGCYMSPFDTLEDALAVYGLPQKTVLAALNQRVKDAKNLEP